jgi:hypothetical protein
VQFRQQSQHTVVALVATAASCTLRRTAATATATNSTSGPSGRQPVTGSKSFRKTHLLTEKHRLRTKHLSSHAHLLIVVIHLTTEYLPHVQLLQLLVVGFQGKRVEDTSQ